MFEAAKRSQNPYNKLIFTAFAQSDQLWPQIPWITRGGGALEYDREGTLPTFEMVAPGHTSLVESTGTIDHVTVPKREGASEFDIRNVAVVNHGDGNPERVQTEMKVKAAARNLAGQIITGGYVTGAVVQSFQSGAYVDSVIAGPWIDSDKFGPGDIRYTNTGTKVAFRAPGDRTFGPDVVAAADGTYTLYSDNPSRWIQVTLDVSDATADAIRSISFTSSTNEFDGLQKLMHPAQVLPSSGANGDNLTLTTLEKLYDQVKVRENLAFVMPASLKQKVSSLMRAAGGVEKTELMNGDIATAWNGIPILINDRVPATEAKGTATTLSSVYLLSLSEGEGVYMIASGTDSMEAAADIRKRPVMGFQMYDLGQLKGINAFGRRLAFYGGLAMGSYLSCARASELITA